MKRLKFDYSFLCSDYQKVSVSFLWLQNLLVYRNFFEIIVNFHFIEYEKYFENVTIKIHFHLPSRTNKRILRELLEVVEVSFSVWVVAFFSFFGAQVHFTLLSKKLINVVSNTLLAITFKHTAPQNLFYGMLPYFGFPFCIVKIALNLRQQIEKKCCKKGQVKSFIERVLSNVIG